MFNQFPVYSKQEIAEARKKVKELANEAKKAINKQNRQNLKSTMEKVENYYNTAPTCCRKDLSNILFDLGKHLAKVS